MYDIIQALCQKNSISIAQMCREIDMHPTIISELKHGRTKNLSHLNMVKIANYFKVPINVFSEKALPINEKDYSNVYDKINDLCKTKNKSITQMCAEAKIPRSALSDYKSGKNKTISINNLQKIADYFDVTVDYLLGNEKKSSAEKPTLSIEAQEVAIAYDKATKKEKEIVRFTLNII